MTHLPPFQETFPKSMIINSQHVKSNKYGAFCVSFILSVKNKNDFKKFIDHFNATLLKQNDKILKRYFSEILIPV